MDPQFANLILEPLRQRNNKPILEQASMYETTGLGHKRFLAFKMQRKGGLQGGKRGPLVAERGV